ncbi:hypothetical protein PENSUB_13105 [Penicillium subrubescens]|uniref:Uncharacterized protein n=1 Tax=Penicillium subrubescens TaxID=1316194 RepID=A0A1Q5ST69_9EURO|nr:hypothetical protein PENSUB_13105 [Penicillium subrubescens]
MYVYLASMLNWAHSSYVFDLKISDVRYTIKIMQKAHHAGGPLCGRPTMREATLREATMREATMWEARGKTILVSGNAITEYPT